MNKEQACPVGSTTIDRSHLEIESTTGLTATPPSGGKKLRPVGLELLTESRLKTFRRCPKEHHYRYELGLAPLETSDALTFGTLFHRYLEAWWGAPKGTDRLTHALTVVGDALDDNADPFDVVKAEELLRGYDIRWGGEQFDVIAVEQQFDLPLVNPETGASSRTFRLAGKVDALARDAHGTWVVEHKTTSLDAGPGSAYITRLRLDGQVSMYLRAASELGHEPVGVLYDVIRKVGLKPLKATPEESRRYNKDGSLDKRQRTTDETPDEYRERVCNEIADNPDKHYVRATVVRLEAELAEFEQELWQFAASMREFARLGISPRNTDSCERYGSKCAFFDVCSGEASVDDEARFVRVGAHPELEV